MSKRRFFSVFWPAWQQAFCKKNVASGFAKTGIWSCSSARVISQIIIPETEPLEQISKTLITCRGVQNLHRVYTRAPSSPILRRILRSNLTLAAQHSVNLHVQNGLVESLKEKKKRRRRGKHLNLCGETDSGPQFFSSSRVQAARDCQRAKETEEAKRLQAIVDKKVAAAADKLRKKNEKKEREASTASRRAEAERKKADKEAKKLRLQEARLAAEQLH